MYTYAGYKASSNVIGEHPFSFLQIYIQQAFLHFSCKVRILRKQCVEFPFSADTTPDLFSVVDFLLNDGVDSTTEHPSPAPYVFVADRWTRERYQQIKAQIKVTRKRP